MARTLSDLGVKLGIIGNNTTQISFDDLNTELGVSSETTRDLGGFSIAGISSLSTSDTTPDEATTVQFQMVPTDVAGSPGFTAWQASDLASTISHFIMQKIRVLEALKAGGQENQKESFFLLMI